MVHAQHVMTMNIIINNYINIILSLSLNNKDTFYKQGRNYNPKKW